jgi:preprotein translocase subunit SecA
MFSLILKSLFGTKHEREVKRLAPLVDQINALEERFKQLSDAELAGKTAEFRQQIENGASLDELLVPAFATVREAGRRVLGMRHYDVQLIGGAVLHQGKIAEMKTGEGKTLVATLPCYLNALESKGVHVVTVNDYLARRDAEWMGKLYGFLGLSTGIVVPGQRNDEKKRAYNCDITYGQNNEYGFDYLRDNMKFSIYDYVQRELNFAIVDEVDSILIDEARTPLIISGPGETASEKYARISDFIPRLRREEHYEVDEKSRQATLTEDGMETAQNWLANEGLIQGGNLFDPVNLESLHILQQCLRAHVLFHRDQHYMVSQDGKILIIDEFTGRVLPGRRWSDGLHQAVEAKEHVPIQDENQTLATISFQNLFRLYKKLSGMTGTADTEAGEFHNIYKLDVVVIPTAKPVARRDEEDVIYKSERAKFKAIAAEIDEAHRSGQPVLVGTTSVEKSDAISRLLEKRGIPHNVLNAKQHEREAYIVAQAGMPGAVTVATNMAGRGTDIVLGGNPEMLAKLDVLSNATDELRADPEAMEVAVEEATTRYVARCKEDQKKVIQAGGLRIVGTERHESRRIDNQLRGRSGRQGDPGVSRFYLSLEDELMRIFAGDRAQAMMSRLGMEEDEPIEHRWVTKAVENAQKKVEERNFDIRKNLLEYDDVMNQQRKSIYSLRRQVLTGRYRAVATEAEIEKGVVPPTLVKETDPALTERVRPVLEQMVKFHAATLPEPGATEDEIESFKRRARESDLATLGPVRWQALERDVYVWFGCVTELKKLADDPRESLAHLEREVGLSLTEQRERLFDLVDELVATMVDRACPANKHFEYWDYTGLAQAFRDQFAIEASGLETFDSQDDLARKLYEDVEAVLKRKLDDFGPEYFLRLFRDLYLEQIDRQWIEHLSSMDHLRDGIGLRGYGQRDPKKEYKREGFTLFQVSLESIKSSVMHSLCRVERAREEDLERMEEQRKAQAQKRTEHQRTNAPQDGGQLPAAGDGGGPGRRARRAAQKRGAAQAPQVQVKTVKRDRPKLGRNDPCWCGSGRKYKACHMREDEATAGQG